ncbi:virulence-associated E family protein [Bradyrhizobium sp. KBS0727]|uniref:virulence-associated E family protein n=1 Tax=unclassified Bradyrhizobium TaxID=2631580 RepID=UPI00110DD46C|nr:MULTISPECIES: virulence-associated E family protein [unclassified Bradyrhizobium]QDW38746.1 virulence-associated E family protein [Bradyrhizobium sp. KBS0725]QDW45350.1 virulence-associated E family protein [Bradyrhizobium sp. KBS0727]
MSNVVSMPPPEWTNGLMRFGSGAPQGTLANGCHALRSSPELKSMLAYDVFAMKTMAVAAPPWDPLHFQQRPWGPHDDLLATEHLQRLGIPIKPQTAAQAVEVVAREQSYHPVLDYLDGNKWDGKPRLDDWLTKYIGANETPYTQSIGRSALIGAVARVRNPGCKVDTVPIIEGKQGLGKSSAARILFDPWFSDELADLGGKDAAMQTQGAWLIEISELDAMTRSEVSRIKAFISRATDRFRPPYGARVIESPRSCVFWGTTNSETYLKDETGGRRFWPIKAGRIDVDGLSSARDQLWAEADHLYRAGAAWWLVNPEAQRIADGEQIARYQGDPWDDAIGEYLKTVTDVSVAEILRDVLHIEIGRQTPADMIRAGRVLTARGLLRTQVRTGDKRAWRYRKASE